MKKQQYDLATEKLTIINWLREKIDECNDLRSSQRLRIWFELKGYDGKNQIIPKELKEELCKVADKLKDFYISEKEKLEKEVEAL